MSTRNEKRAAKLVVGLGLSGLAAAAFLCRRGEPPAVSERRPAAEISELLGKLEELGVTEVETGGHRPEFFCGRRQIVASPGVPSELPALVAARAAGAEIIGEIELAARAIDVPLIAVTGTNGKTTTVNLLDEVFKAAGKKVFAGGNLGRPALEMTEDDYELGVWELSSFQLETVASGFRSKVAVILNLSPDHQDRYVDTEAYLAAKARISMNQTKDDYLLLNLDDPHLAAYGRALAARRAAGVSLPRLLWFSCRREVETGVSWQDDEIVMCLPQAGGGRRIERLSAPTLRLPGEHNRSNFLAALLASHLVGLENEVIIAAAASFEGLAHRLEFVGEVDGVSWYNDSKATNLDAVIKAVESFTAPLVLLLGGRDKGADFSTLISTLRSRVRLLLPFGEAGDKIVRELAELKPEVPACELAAAVARARREAESGEVVLLSPGCASFDEFADYRARGDMFRHLVASFREERE